MGCIQSNHRYFKHSIKKVRHNQNQMNEKYKNDTSLKTSHEWYVLTSVYKNLYDPDGWRNEDNPAEFWHTQPITFQDFLRRCNQSTQMTPNHHHFGRPNFPYGMRQQLFSDKFYCE
jgi:hypothetical protein